MALPLLQSLLALNGGLTLWLAFLLLRLAWRVSELRGSGSKSAAGLRAAPGPEPITPEKAVPVIDVPPIDELVHVRTVPPLPLKDATQASALAQLRADVRERAEREGLPLGQPEQAVLADDLSCCRYLLARKWDVPAAAAMLYGSLAWRVRRAPPHLVTDLDSRDGRFLRSEGQRGKV